MTIDQKKPFIIPVFSGKGGVGKTTMSVNIALSLKRKGYKVGIADVDIDTPNLCQIAGLPTGIKFKITDDEKILPYDWNGIDAISLGFTFPEGAPVLWDDTQKSEVIDQLIRLTVWNDPDFIIVDAPAGCLTAESLIYTNPSGSQYIENIKENDTLYSFDGVIKHEKTLGRKIHSFLDGKLVSNKVKRIIPQGSKDVYMLKTVTKSIKATANHPFLVLNREKKKTDRNWNYHLRWIPLRHIKENDLVGIVRSIPDQGKSFKLPLLKEENGNTQNYVSCPTITNEDFCRIIGYYLGDGYMKKNNGIYDGIVFCEPKNDTRTYYITLLKKIFKPDNIFEKELQYGINSRIIGQFFSDLDLDHKAKDKYIPKWVFSLPNNEKIQVLLGYLDADGHRKIDMKDGYTSKRWQFESASKKLIEDFHTLAVCLGMRVANICYRKRKVSLGKLHKVNIEYAESWSFSINPFKPPKKGFGPKLRVSDLYNDEIGWELVKSIQKLPEKEETYDIEMEQDLPNFIANGFIVHNTGSAVSAALNLDNVIGAIIVTTPHAAAVADAKRAMQVLWEYRIPLIGIINNMSYFQVTCPCECNHSFELRYTKDQPWNNEDLLAEFPIQMEILEKNIIPNFDFVVNKILDRIPNLKVKEYKRNISNRLKEKALRYAIRKMQPTQ